MGSVSGSDLSTGLGVRVLRCFFLLVLLLLLLLLLVVLCVLCLLVVC